MWRYGRKIRPTMSSVVLPLHLFAELPWIRDLWTQTSLYLTLVINNNLSWTSDKDEDELGSM
jgi:hypothetical protein